MRLEILVHHAGSRISYSYTALRILKVHFLAFLISPSQTHEARQETWPSSAWQIRPKIQAGKRRRGFYQPRFSLSPKHPVAPDMSSPAVSGDADLNSLTQVLSVTDRNPKAPTELNI